LVLRERGESPRLLFAFECRRPQTLILSDTGYIATDVFDATTARQTGAATHFN
jgi:hypothetical protein